MSEATNNPIATADKFADAFGDYTGSDYERGGVSYPYLIILQSDKTFDNFVDGDQITKSQYGKLFVRSNNKNQIKDLKDSFKGIVIKEQKGAELWVNGKCLFTANHFVDQETKEGLAVEHGCKPEDVRNVIKVLLKLVPKEELFNGDVYEYAIITIKGSSFMPYNDQVKEKQQELFLTSEQFKAMKISNVSKVPVVFWTLDISSQYISDPKTKREYYSFAFKVSETPTDVAFALKDDMVKAAEFDLISMRKIGSQPVSEAISNNDVQEDPRSDKEMEKDIVEGEILSVEVEIDNDVNPDDLPF